MSCTILIIEDNESVSDAMSQRLRSFGFDVISANSMEHADALASGVHPDVVLMDMRFADNAPPSPSFSWSDGVPMVLLSGDEKETPAHLEHCGMLSLPFSGNDLLDSVSDALWQSAGAANDAVA